MQIIQAKRELSYDLHKAVSLYLSARAYHKVAWMVESADTHPQSGNRTVIGFDPLVEWKLVNERLSVTGVMERSEEVPKRKGAVSEVIWSLCQELQKMTPHDDLRVNGFLGYTMYHAVEYFEDIKLTQVDDTLPAMHYIFFKYYVVIDYFRSKITVLENRLKDAPSQLNKVITALEQYTSPNDFSLEADEHSPMTDEYYKNIVSMCKEHCQRGDVFQIVPSRPFEQAFKGDPFQVYRTLKRINPSPYAFYYEIEDMQLGGASPEAQIIVADGYAEIHPIAGTYRRTGDDKEDERQVKKLQNDPKEVSEHVMLVDLARNDLSIFATDIEVVSYKEPQYYSHVIHLTSVVRGKLLAGVNPISIYTRTFPAGTLSGAPKYRAMELIDGYEKTPRASYAGALGFMGFDGRVIHAIMIRSFMGNRGKIKFQAGAGVVIDSDEQKELEEVNHKVGAIRKALSESYK